MAPKPKAEETHPPKTQRMRAIQLGWYGNRRRREGAEFPVTLNWIPERRHERDNKDTGDKKGDVVAGTGCYEKAPTWAVPVKGKAVEAEPVEVDELEEDAEESLQQTGDPKKSDESPL